MKQKEKRSKRNLFNIDCCFFSLSSDHRGFQFSIAKHKAFLPATSKQNHVGVDKTSIFKLLRIEITLARLQNLLLILVLIFVLDISKCFLFKEKDFSDIINSDK